MQQRYDKIRPGPKQGASLDAVTDGVRDRAISPDFVALAADGSNAAAFLDQFRYSALKQSYDAEGTTRPLEQWLNRDLRELLLSTLLVSDRGDYGFLFDGKNPPGTNFHDHLFTGRPGDARALLALPAVAESISRVLEQSRLTIMERLKELQDQMVPLAPELAKSQQIFMDELEWARTERPQRIALLGKIALEVINAERRTQVSPDYLAANLLSPVSGVNSLFGQARQAFSRGRIPAETHQLKDSNSLDVTLTQIAPFQAAEFRQSPYFDRWIKNGITDLLLATIRRNPMPLLTRICGIKPDALKREKDQLVISDEVAIVLLAIADNQETYSSASHGTNFSLHDEILKDYGLNKEQPELITQWKSIMRDLFNNVQDKAHQNVQSDFAASAADPTTPVPERYQQNNGAEQFNQVIAHDEAFTAAQADIEAARSQLALADDELKEQLSELKNLTSNWRNCTIRNGEQDKAIMENLYGAVAAALCTFFRREHQGLPTPLKDQDLRLFVGEILGLRVNEIPSGVTRPIANIMQRHAVGGWSFRSDDVQDLDMLAETFRTNLLPRILVGLEATDAEVAEVAQQLKEIFDKGGTVQFAQLQELIKD